MARDSHYEQIFQGELQREYDERRALGMGHECAKHAAKHALSTAMGRAVIWMDWWAESLEPHHATAEPGPDPVGLRS